MTENKVSLVNPSYVYAYKGEEVLLENFHDKDFVYITVVRTREKVVCRKELICEVADNKVIIINEQEKPKPKASSRKTKSQSKEDKIQGELF